MTFKQGDIVWIDAQYIGDTASKPRPCIIVSNKSSNSIDSDYIICPITSNIRLDAFSVVIDNNDLSRSLPKSCEIRTNKMFAYSASKILNKHCEVINNAKLKEIIDKSISAIEIQ